MSVVVTLIRPVLLLLALSHPPGGGEGPDGDRPPPPPPEAIDSCADKSSGDACSFEGREGETLSGTCFSPSSDLPLACRPPHPPGPRGG